MPVLGPIAVEDATLPRRNHHVTARTHHLGDVTVDGTRDLDVAARAYELTCELTWDLAHRAGNVGFEVLKITSVVHGPTSRPGLRVADTSYTTSE